MIACIIAEIRIDAERCLAQLVKNDNEKKTEAPTLCQEYCLEMVRIIEFLLPYPD